MTANRASNGKATRRNPEGPAVSLPAKGSSRVAEPTGKSTNSMAVSRGIRAGVSQVQDLGTRRTVPIPMATRYVPFFNLIFWGFVLLMVSGGIALTLPVASATGAFTSPADAFFTAVSAVSATGLVVRDTKDAWSPTGHLIIAALIQVGGLGFMIISAFVLLVVGKRIDVNDPRVSDTLGSSNKRSFLAFAAATILATVVIEAAGTALLFARSEYAFPERGWEWSAFSSISAFNNAGFDLEGNLAGITAFQQDPYVLGIISGLFIIGGLGIPFLVPLVSRRPWVGWSLDAKVTVIASVALLLAGSALIGAFEVANDLTLKNLGGADGPMNAFFLSASSRTAGYSAVAVGSLREETLMFVMVLMFIGGATGSTAGGVKVTTFATIFMTAFSYLRGHRRVHAFGRIIPEVQVHRAIAIIFLGVIFVFGFTLLLRVTERFNFIELLFETVSAFSTTGLSRGITPDLSLAGKSVLMVAMFVGRLGPLTAVLALSRGPARPEPEHHPEESIRFG